MIIVDTLDSIKDLPADAVKIVLGDGEIIIYQQGDEIPE
jgi:hypothetical protein